MALFSIAWLPLFFLFWRSLRAGADGADAGAADAPSSGFVWPLLTGLILALLRVFLGAFGNAYGAGFERWLAGFVDYTSLAPLAALFVCALLPSLFKSRKPFTDWTGFVLAACAVAAPFYAAGWSARAHPLYLALPPLLWTSAALAAGFFRRLFCARPGRAAADNADSPGGHPGGRSGGGQNRGAAVRVVCAVFAFGCLNAAAWTAFFFQRPVIGGALLIPALAVSIAAICGRNICGRRRR